MTAGMVVRLIVMAMIAVAAWITLAVTLSFGHGDAEWIQRGGYKNAAGEACCGARDCAAFLSGRIAAVAGGYDVDATFRLTNAAGIAVDYQVREFVPYAEATPSPDGAFWRCQWDGARKCFFAPPSNT